MKKKTLSTRRAAVARLRNKSTRIVLFLLLILSYASARANEFPLEGNGDERYPYLIQSIDDWNYVATEVEDGNSFYNKCFRLTADITVDISHGDRMIGNYNISMPFCGQFDGVGHTLTFKYLNGDGYYVAPFRYIVDARIERLCVTGTLHTSGRFAGGIVGRAMGLNRLESCHVSLNMILDRGGDVSCGGLVGIISEDREATLEIYNCLFDGSFSCTLGISSNSCGGFVGWANDEICKVYNCFFNPSELLPLGRKAISTDGCATLIRYRNMNENLKNHVDNCLYTRTLGLAQGESIDRMSPRVIVDRLNDFGGYDFELWELNDDSQAVPAMRVGSFYFVNVVGIEDKHYIPDGQSSIQIPYTIYDDTWHELIIGKDCKVSLHANHSIIQQNQNPITIDAVGEYIFEVTTTYSGVYDPSSWYDRVFIVENEMADFSGKGTSDDPYLITDTTDWNKFVGYVNNGSFSSRHYLLTDDISVTTMSGDADHSFKGTFDGGGHTITIAYDTDVDWAAPFLSVDGATIKNLHTKGTLTTSNKHASGLVGHALGNTTIDNCVVSVVITGSINGDGTLAGLVGEHGCGNYTTNISRCVFDGKLLTTGNTEQCAGFVGWRNMILYITDCLYAPAELGEGEMEVLVGSGGNPSATFSRNGVSSIRNSFYTRPLGREEGALSHAMNVAPTAVLGSLVKGDGFVKTYEHGLEYNGKYYVAAEIALRDDADNSALLALCNGYLLSRVTLEGRTFFADSTWNTLCLPFDVDDLSDTPLVGATVMTLDNGDGSRQTRFDSTTGTLYLSFKPATRIEAGKPYIIRWEGHGGTIVSPSFENVTLRYAMSPIAVDSVVCFRGTYGNMVFETADTGILFLGENNLLHYPLPTATIGACRGFFQLADNLTAGEPDDDGRNAVRAFEFELGDERPTGLSPILDSSRQGVGAGTMYSLDGRKIENSQIPKGIYVRNGRKVVVK